MPLGLFSGEVYTAVELPFAPGDRCVLYTDGIPEAKNAEEEEFGTTRFLAFLESERGLPADRFAEALLDRLFAWTAYPRGLGQRDDLTLLAIHFDSQ